MLLRHLIHFIMECDEDFTVIIQLASDILFTEFSCQSFGYCRSISEPYGIGRKRVSEYMALGFDRGKQRKDAKEIINETQAPKSPL